MDQQIGLQVIGDWQKYHVVDEINLKIFIFKYANIYFYVFEKMQYLLIRRSFLFIYKIVPESKEILSWNFLPRLFRFSKSPGHKKK